MLLVVSVMAVAGVIVLWMLAERYRRMEPLPSVRSVEAPPPARRSLPQESASPVRAESSDPAAPAEAMSRVEAFIVVRRGVKKVLDDHPAATRWIDRETGELLEDLELRDTKLRLQLLGQVKLAQIELFQETGITGEEYQEVREVYRAWVRGGPEDGNPLRSAFETRREELESLYLGILEPFDI